MGELPQQRQPMGTGPLPKPPLKLIRTQTCSAPRQDLCHPHRRVMGLRPTQGDEKRLPLSSRPKRTRISCHASLTSGTVCGFHQGKPHEARRSQPIHRKSGEAKWRDLRCALLPNESPPSTITVTLVIPTEAKRSGGTCGAPWSLTNLRPAPSPLPLSSRPKRSEVEGPAVRPSP